jgi:hypothetical protein
VISVNTTGFSAANAAGTTYNGATPLLRASVPIKPGAHSVYFSVFDQADNSLDSAAFLDNVRTFSSSGGCHVGAVPPPVAGKSFDAEPVSGSVFFKCRGGTRQRLQTGVNLPMGCVIDARNGKMRLTSAANSSSTSTKSAVFYSGQFKVKEKRSSRPITELALAGKLAACPKRKRKKGTRKSDARRDASDARRKRRKRGRRLWGRGKGRFRTRGRRSTATVRGTTWLVYDRCDGSTYNKVTSGRVTVRDLGRRKTIRLNAKRRRVYIARARKH